MNFLKEFPDKETLLASYVENGSMDAPKVNNHIHTPYSFSAFDSVSEAVERAEQEGIKVLGINDFYVADGHQEFINCCLEHGIFPLLNIELIGVSSHEQEAGIRINDPKNPGRIYLSGKGLSFPFSLPSETASKLQNIVKGSNSQVAEMITLLNGWMAKQGITIELSMQEILENYAMTLLRERHVARRVRLILDEQAPGQEDYEAVLTALYNSRPAVTDRKDIAGTEEELRSRLLKAGAPAFVPEGDDAFPSLKEIMSIIRSAGGFPTYPMLLDGAGTVMTEFESSREKLKEVLEMHGIRAVELIPLRNDIQILKEYAGFFYENGFVVSFGTEHNTSAMIPVEVSAKGGAPLDRDLMNISFNGAAFQAAHHYLNSQNELNTGSRDEMEMLGKAVFQHYFKNYIPSKSAI